MSITGATCKTCGNDPCRPWSDAHDDDFAKEIVDAKRKSVPIHTHRRCVDCGRFVKSVRCGRDHRYDNWLGLLCDPCYGDGFI